MNAKMTKFICSLLLAIATITAAQAEDFLALDEAIRNSNTAKYAPLFDFDTDGCLPSAGISRDGQMNPGLRTTGHIGGDCRSPDFLETSNTLHRHACINHYGTIYCGHFYSLYFEKDQTTLAGCPDCGHVHDWELVVVWTTDGVITHVCASAHGGCDPVDASSVLFENDHVMIVYHREGAPNTHSFRFANSGDVADPENPYERFVTPTLASWYELTGDGISNKNMREKLNSFDYYHASIPMKDSNFLKNLWRYKPSSYPYILHPMWKDCQFSAWFSEEEGSETCPTGYVVTGIACSMAFCDRKQLICCGIPDLILRGPKTEKASYWFSEEGTNYFKSDNKAVVGMQCLSDYCDWISLITRSAVGKGGEWAEETFSDEGFGVCDSGYVAGVECTGRYCDNLRLYCKEIGHPSGPAINELLLLDD